MLYHMEDMANRGLSQSTRKKYRQLFDRLKAWCDVNGVVMLAQLNVTAMRAFRGTWEVTGITSNKMLERLRSFLNFCVDSGWMEKNPSSVLRKSKEEQPETQPFTDNEVEAIIKHVDTHCLKKHGEPLRWAQRLRALVLLLRWSALRISDAVMLTPAHVDGDSIRLRPMKTREQNTWVKIPVPPEVLEALDQIGAPGGYYFGHSGGKVETRAGDWRRELRKVFAATVPGGHAHRFRDTRAVELLNAGASIEDVAAILGHKDVRITQKHYAPWVKSRQDRMEEQVKKTFRSKHST